MPVFTSKISFARLTRRRSTRLAALFAAGVLGYFFVMRTDEIVEQIRKTSPENLRAYQLNPEDRGRLARLYALAQAREATELAEWVRQRRCPLQRIGIFLAEQSMLLRTRAQTDLAQAKLDTALALGAILLAVTQDSFLLRHTLFIKNLTPPNLRARVQLSETFAVARELFLQRNYSKSAQWLQRVRTLAHEAHENRFLIEASYLLQYAWRKQSRYLEVITLSHEIVRLAQNSNYRLCLAAALAEAADAYSHLGKKDSALVVLKSATDFALTIQDSVGLARCYFSQAQLQMQAGKYVEAERSLAQVGRFDNLHKYRGQITNLQAHIAGMICEYGRAEELYLEALESSKQNHDRGNQIQIAIAISKIKTRIGDYPGALEWAQHADRCSARGSTEKERLSEALGQLGWVYVQMDSMPQAIQALQAAVESAGQSSKVDLANIKSTLGKAYLKQREFERARTHFLEAEKIATSGDIKIIPVEARLGLAEVALADGQIMQAQALFTHASDLAQRAQETSLENDALLGIAETQRRLNEPRKALHTLNRAFALGETLRVSLRHDSARVTYFSKLQDGYDLAVGVAWELGDPQLALHYAERGRARALRDAFAAATSAGTTPSERFTNRFEVPAVNELQKSIPDQAQVLEYRVTSDTLYLWLLQREAIHVRRIAMTAQALSDIIIRFRVSIGALDYDAFLERSGKDTAQVYEENLRLGKELFAILLKPVAAELDTNKLLYLVPDEMLHLLPWGALVDEDERFFDEIVAWVKAPSLEILARSAASQTTSSARSEAGLLMIAGDLPSVAAQKQSLKKMFRHFTFLRGAQATFNEVKQALAAANNEVVYFSVRAVADMKQPLNSYMELAEENATAATPRRKAYVRELQAWNFSNVDVVILNGCETASGKIERGEGGMSMARFFTRAQVPHVLASLWMNDDRISAQIIDDFLAGMKRDDDLTKSLQRAKRNSIQRLAQKYRYPLPYFWAAFELHESSFSLANLPPND